MNERQDKKADFIIMTVLLIMGGTMLYHMTNDDTFLNKSKVSSDIGYGIGIGLTSLAAVYVWKN